MLILVFLGANAGQLNNPPSRKAAVAKLKAINGAKEEGENAPFYTLNMAEVKK